jgi:hypothetical protein
MNLRERRVAGIFPGGSRVLQEAEFPGVLTWMLIQVRCFLLEGHAVRATRPFLSFALGSYGR